MEIVAGLHYKTLIRSKNTSRGTKIKIYRTLIRPILKYACETWTIKKQNENRLRIAERKILRGIYGPKETKIHSSIVLELTWNW